MVAAPRRQKTLDGDLAGAGLDAGRAGGRPGLSDHKSQPFLDRPQPYRGTMLFLSVMEFAGGVSPARGESCAAALSFDASWRIVARRTVLQSLSSRQTIGPGQ